MTTLYALGGTSNLTVFKSEDTDDWCIFDGKNFLHLAEIDDTILLKLLLAIPAASTIPGFVKEVESILHYAQVLYSELETLHNEAVSKAARAVPEPYIQANVLPSLAHVHFKQTNDPFVVEGLGEVHYEYYDSIKVYSAKSYHTSSRYSGPLTPCVDFLIKHAPK